MTTSRITIIENKSLKKDTVELHCNQLTPEVSKLKNYGEHLDQRILVQNKDQKQMVPVSSIYYIESIDKHTFLYLKESIMEINLRLYQLEETLNPLYFIRISKSCIVNISYVKSINMMINRNLELTLINQEKIIVSKRYVKDFNKLIGME